MLRKLRAVAYLHLANNNGFVISNYSNFNYIILCGLTFYINGKFRSKLLYVLTEV